MSNTPKGTVNAPGGPARVFGKINTSHTGAESASDISIPADKKSALSDFKPGTVAERYDESYARVEEAFNDLDIHTRSRYIHFTDGDGNRMNYDDMVNDYSNRESEGDTTSDLTMVIDFCNTGDGLTDATNAQEMNLDGKNSKIRRGWSVTEDNAIQIPVDDVISSPYSDEIEEYAEAMKIVEEDFPVLNTAIYSELEQEAIRNTFTDSHDIDHVAEVIAEGDYDMMIDGMDPEDEDYQEIDQEDYISEKKNEYLQMLNVDNVSSSFSALREQGHITGSDYEYIKKTKSMDISGATLYEICDHAIKHY